MGRQKKMQRNRSVSESSSWERNPRRRQYSIGSVGGTSYGVTVSERRRADSIGSDLNPICAQNGPLSECSFTLERTVDYNLISFPLWKNIRDLLGIATSLVEFE